MSLEESLGYRSTIWKFKKIRESKRNSSTNATKTNRSGIKAKDVPRFSCLSYFMQLYSKVHHIELVNRVQKAESCWVLVGS